MSAAFLPDAASSARRARPNDPCPCGSGRKFKKCCDGNGVAVPSRPAVAGLPPVPAAPAGRAAAAVAGPAPPTLGTVIASLDAAADARAHAEALREPARRLLEHVRSTVGRYQRHADGPAHDALRRLRDEIGEVLGDLDDEALPRWWALLLRDAVAIVRGSGIRNAPRTADEQSRFAALRDELAVASPGAASVRLLLRASLLCQAFELPFQDDFWAVPVWAQEGYLAFALEEPQIFLRIGDARRHHAYMARTVAIIHRLAVIPAVLQAGSPAFRLARAFATQANFVQTYFSEANLRKIYARRGEIISAWLVAEGHPTLRAMVARPLDGRRLRVGIVAQHFGPQTETFFMLAHFDGIDREHFEVILYPLSLTGHPFEQHCRSRADRLVDLGGLGLDAQVAAIRDDALDAVVLGTNMTAVSNACTLLGHHRLAPLQLASVSSPVTTGGRHVDVLLSAEDNEPSPRAQDHYTERLWRMPGSVNYYAYNYDDEPATAQAARADWGVDDEQVVFFSGANYFKVLPELSASWARILAAVPRSVLVLLPFNANWSSAYQRLPFARRLRAELQAQGVGPERLLLLEPVPTRADVHALVALADVYLDAYPFAGACSMLDPILAGVPAVVRAGEAGRSCHGASLMRMIGLPEEICRSESDYEARAIALARSPAERARLRVALQAQHRVRPPVYFDLARFSKRVGEALLGLHAEQCARQEVLSTMGRSALVCALRRLAARALESSLELSQLTDIGLVGVLVEPFFRTAAAGRPHVIDVGACHGAMSMPLLASGWTADLFEPDPAACAVLRRQVAAHGDACRIHEVAIAAGDATEIAFHQAEAQGLSGLAASPFGATSALLRVPCRRLADHCRAHGLARVDLLKIDAEGFDFDVLETHDFAAARPRLVLVEFGTHFARQTLAQVDEAMARMVARGYGALVFGYDDDGNFAQGRWQYRLTSLLVDAPASAAAPAGSGRSFGNILFYERDDRSFLSFVHALLESCIAPCER